MTTTTTASTRFVIFAPIAVLFVYAILQNFIRNDPKRHSPSTDGVKFLIFFILNEFTGNLRL